MSRITLYLNLPVIFLFFVARKKITTNNKKLKIDKIKDNTAHKKLNHGDKGIKLNK
jgi:hypothetical protein